MPFFTYAIPSVKVLPTSGESSNFDLTIKCPIDIVFKTIIVKLKDDPLKKVEYSKFKDKNAKHYYSLYGISWIKVSFDEGIKYKCLECGKLYKKQNTLFPHINNHRNDRLYKCQYCPKSYFAQKSLTTHKNKNHADKINYEFYCPVCNKGYMLKHAFMRHLQDEAAK